MNRPVRDDQHGTTGYAYGCRCSDCALARRTYMRAYVKDNPGWLHVSEEKVDLVFAGLLKHADLDDEVTVSATDISSSLGISQPHVSNAIRHLVNLGRLEDIKRTSHGIHHLRILDGAA